MARARQAEKGEFYKESKSVKRYRNTKKKSKMQNRQAPKEIHKHKKIQ